MVSVLGVVAMLLGTYLVFGYLFLMAYLRNMPEAILIVVTTIIILIKTNNNDTTSNNNHCNSE